MRLRGALLGLYLALALVASTGVALQMYLMQVQNPSLRGDLCQAHGGEAEASHSLLCGLQMAPGLPPVAEPAPPTLLQVLRERLRQAPGYPSPASQSLAPRPPPFA
ncbi:hypothetical protein [Thermus sediminis]|uniref:hypothetical protein n=1 Tax=Thermus sediminis TaxID=1761908 RepID=UPI000E3E2F36|nr:hypothetical protein [Thermus sediminis]